MVEGVCVAATHGDCGLCVRMKRKGWGGEGEGLREGRVGFFDKFL